MFSSTAQSETIARLRAQIARIEHDVMNGSPHPISFVEIEIKRPDLLEK